MKVKMDMLHPTSASNRHWKQLVHLYNVTAVNRTDKLDLK